MRYFSVLSCDRDILKALSDIHLKGEWFDADITYSKGIFYDVLQPKYKSDMYPINNSITQDDAQILEKLPVVNSIVFDPPFLFRNRKSVNKDKMCFRFKYFKSYDELCSMYEKSLTAIYSKLKDKGWLFFKCQDMTDGKFYCTHNFIINTAEKIGFELKDIGIKSSNKKLQKDALQQNCFAKTHSYWLVFKKLNQAKG